MGEFVLSGFLEQARFKFEIGVNNAPERHLDDLQLPAECQHGYSRFISISHLEWNG